MSALPRLLPDSTSTFTSAAGTLQNPPHGASSDLADTFLLKKHEQPVLCITQVMNLL